MYDVKNKTNIKYFYTDIISENSLYINIYHPIYKYIKFNKIIPQIEIYTIDNSLPIIKINLNNNDWVKEVNEYIKYNLKDIINGFSKLPSYWANGWGDYEDNSIKLEAIESALKIVDIIENLELPLPNIRPQCFRTIIFDWKNCEIEVFDNNALEFYYEFDGENEKPINFVIEGSK